MGPLRLLDGCTAAGSLPEPPTPRSIVAGRVCRTCSAPWLLLAVCMPLVLREPARPCIPPVARVPIRVTSTIAAELYLNNTPCTIAPKVAPYDCPLPQPRTRSAA
jgi:hypothetical protein